MLQDLIGSFIVAAVMVAVAAAIIWLIVKYDAAKMAVFVFVSIFVLAAAAGCFAEMGADFDEVVVEVTSVKPVIVDNELLLEVHFNYEGEELSWYEELKDDNVFDVKVKYLVKIYLPGNEVVDANPYGGLAFYFLTKPDAHRQIERSDIMDKEGWIGMIPHGPVKAYGYRKAHVVGGICFTPKRAIYDRVLDTLIRRSGLSEYEGKNHILFVFDGLAVQFDDYVISVSASYEVKSW